MYSSPCAPLPMPQGETQAFLCPARRVGASAPGISPQAGLGTRGDADGISHRSFIHLSVFYHLRMVPDRYARPLDLRRVHVIGPAQRAGSPNCAPAPGACPRHVRETPRMSAWRSSLVLREPLKCPTKPFRRRSTIDSSSAWTPSDYRTPASSWCLTSAMRRCTRGSATTREDSSGL